MRTEITLIVPGTSSSGRLRFAAVPLHVVHLAVEAFREPVGQARSACVEIDITGKADLLKAELTTPCRRMSAASFSRLTRAERR